MAALLLLVAGGAALVAILISESIWARRFEHEQQVKEAERQAFYRERREWQQERAHLILEAAKERRELYGRIQHPEFIVGPEQPTREVDDAELRTAEEDEYHLVGTIDTGFPEDE